MDSSGRVEGQRPALEIVGKHRLRRRRERHAAAPLGKGGDAVEDLGLADTGGIERGTRLKTLRGEVIDPEIAANRGRIIKTTGDGFLLEFGSVVDFVRCAMALQRMIAAREAEYEAEHRTEFRIGINLSGGLYKRLVDAHWPRMIERDGDRGGDNLMPDDTQHDPDIAGNGECLSTADFIEKIGERSPLSLDGNHFERIIAWRNISATSG